MNDLDLRSVNAADWLYQTHVKNYRIFSRVLLRLFPGLIMLYNTAVYMINTFYNIARKFRYPNSLAEGYLIWKAMVF